MAARLAPIDPTYATVITSSPPTSIRTTGSREPCRAQWIGLESFVLHGAEKSDSKTHLPREPRYRVPRFERGFLDAAGWRYVRRSCGLRLRRWCSLPPRRQSIGGPDRCAHDRPTSVTRTNAAASSIVASCIARSSNSLHMNRCSHDFASLRPISYGADCKFGSGFSFSRGTGANHRASNQEESRHPCPWRRPSLALRRRRND